MGERERPKKKSLLHSAPLLRNDIKGIAWEGSKKGDFLRRWSQWEGDGKGHPPEKRI